VTAAYAGLTALQVYWSGISALTVCYLAVALYFAAEAVQGRAFAARATAIGREKRRIGSKHILFFLVTIAAGIVLLRFENVTVSGRPLLAGAAFGEISASASATVGAKIAAPGYRIVVFDAEVRSHLGARLHRVSYSDFELRADGQLLEPLSGQSLYLPDACAGMETTAWSSARCRVAFEVPVGASRARLRLAAFSSNVAWSDANLAELGQADVPRVELTTRTGLRRALQRKPGLERVDVLVRAEPLAGAAPVDFDFLMLEGAGGWRAVDRSGQLGLRNGCAVAVAAQRMACVAVFEIPAAAAEARLRLTTYSSPLPGALVRRSGHRSVLMAPGVESPCA
jgi:hypothetical protein